MTKLGTYTWLQKIRPIRLIELGNRKDISPVDEKLLLVLALYQQGFGAKEISKRLFGNSTKNVITVLRRCKEFGAFESGRKSPVWLGLTQAKQCIDATYAKQMRLAYLADNREWMKGVRRYEDCVNNEPKWKIHSRRMFKDPNQRLRFYLRKRLRHAAKGGKRYSLPIAEIIGCSPAELRAKLETKFLPWMNWENYGKAWHIDHEIPCRAFNLLDPEQAKKCFHHTNLKPMEAGENIRKGDLMPDGTRARDAA